MTDWHMLHTLEDMLGDDFLSPAYDDHFYDFSSFHPESREQSPFAFTPPMPPTTRTAPLSTEVVDLTNDVPVSTDPTNSAGSRRGSGQHPPSSTEASQGRKRKRDEEPILEQTVAEEKEQTPRPQEQDEGRTKIGQMTCIICMEAFVNATTGLCGHMFCHECLTRALMASERHQDRGAGTCPTCRKPIYRKRANQVIPINFMKKSTYKKRG